MEYDAARKIAQGLGAHLEDPDSLVEVPGDKAKLLPVSERTRHLFGKDQSDTPTAGRQKKKQSQLDLFVDLAPAGNSESAWGDKTVNTLGDF